MRLASAIILCFFISCSSKNHVPAGVIKPDEMKVIVWDMLQADELARQNKIADTSMNLNKESFKLYDEVFAIHHTTRKEFYHSYQYYQEHPDKFKLLITAVKQIGDKEKKDRVGPK